MREDCGLGDGSEPYNCSKHGSSWSRAAGTAPRRNSERSVSATAGFIWSVRPWNHNDRNPRAVPCECGPAARAHMRTDTISASREAKFLPLRKLCRHDAAPGRRLRPSRGELRGKFSARKLLKFLKMRKKPPGPEHAFSHNRGEDHSLRRPCIFLGELNLRWTLRRHLRTVRATRAAISRN